MDHLKHSDVSTKVAKTWSKGGVRAILRKVHGRVSRKVHSYRRVYEAGGWKEVLAHLRRQARHRALRSLGRVQSEKELIRVSAEYWSKGERAGIDIQDYSHWLGAGPWRDRERWLNLGRAHFRMYEALTRHVSAARPLRRIVEWGSGGGANAIHFVHEADEFCGIEISERSLDECARVLAAEGFRGFRSVLISAETPEQAVRLAGGPFDFYLNTYVFELLPGKEYGRRVLRVAYDLLKPDGIALIQIRYDDGSKYGASKHLDYYKNAYAFTSYRIDEFWMLAEGTGFLPQYVRLVPRRTEEFSGDLYAYFALVKPFRA